jgi:hypothetical protein
MTDTTTDPSANASNKINPYPIPITEVAAFAISGGWSTEEAPTAVAVSMAQTGGTIDAVVPGDGGSTEYGLWGIPYPQHAELFENGSPKSGAWMFGQYNAQMALSLKGAGGWEAWSTYRSGAYLAYLPSAKMAVSQVENRISQSVSNSGHGLNVQQEALTLVSNDTMMEYAALVLAWREGQSVAGAVGAANGAISDTAGNVVTGLHDTVAPFTSVLDFLNALGRTSTWVRIAEAVIGGALVILALREVAK